MLFKGSPPSVERARFLVTEALNSPSIFQNQGRNNITLGGFIEQKTLTSTTSSPSTQHHSTAVPHESDPTFSKQSYVTTTSPRTVISSPNASSPTGSMAKPAAQVHISSQSFVPQPAHSQLPTNRVSYSKVTSGAWHNSQKMKVTNFVAKVLW